MANLEELALQVRNAGYSEINAEAKVCQDMDLDFIRYSLSEDSIRAFVSRLNCLEGITISITGDIEELSQQEYRGKRVYVTLEDDTGHAFLSKIDLGVHKQVQIEQKEQIFTEKLRSLLRFGPLSTRYKDVFDMCYLSDYVDKSRLQQCMATYIFSDPGMRENDMDGIMRRVNRTFSDRLYKRNIERAGNANWLEIGVPETFEKIETFLSSFDRDIQVRNCSSMCF